MALFNCTECGKEISDKAPACINCGCPVEAMKVEKKVEYIDIQDLLASFKSRYPSSTKTQQQSYLMYVFSVDYNEYDTLSITGK